MKKNIFFLLLCYLFIESTLAHAQGTIAVRELIQRVSRQSEIPVSLKLKPEKNSTYYQYEVRKEYCVFKPRIMFRCVAVFMIT